MAHLLGEALNGAALIAPLQSHSITVFGDASVLATAMAFAAADLALAAHLHENSANTHQQHRRDDGGHHQRDGGAQRAAPVVLAWRFEWRYHGVF